MAQEKSKPKIYSAEFRTCFKSVASGSSATTAWMQEVGQRRGSCREVRLDQSIWERIFC